MKHIRFIISLPLLAIGSISRLITLTCFYMASFVGDDKTAVFIIKTLNKDKEQ